MLLPFSPGVIWFGPGRSNSRRHLHHLHAGLLRLFLQDMDRSVGIFRQRCEFVLLLSFQTPALRYINIPRFTLCTSGSKAAEGAANGHEGAQGDVDGARA